ncbi:MAG: dihydrolipoamide acetyltransferase component of pyruvate dehydrogenase complex [marine bacterium B5-7]|nr:MAG: dihydrolipoamide acetyltransferase component of pyruvate dehydrogenase complex [marine bacterium B5-7]
MTIFNLPDLGEGLPDAEIHEWHVKEGDEIKVDEPLASMETAKAVVEVPSPVSGKVLKLHGNPGDVINTDAPLVTFETAEEPVEAPTADKPASGATVAGNIEIGNAVLEESATGVAVAERTSTTLKAMPAVRSLAQQLGVNLSTVTATGHEGQVTAEDVKKAAGLGGQTVAASPALQIEGLEPLRGPRRMMAQAMAQSHAEVVGITIVDDADLHLWPKKTDVTARVIRALIYACKEEPALNAWYDTASMSRKLFKEIHLGLAMDAGAGLFVPVIRDAHDLDAAGVRAEIQRYKQEVAERTISPNDLKDATISLSNFGVFAGRYANPVVVPPAVCILGTGKMRDSVVAFDGNTAIHRIMPLSLTFDHRAVTGGEASRFLGAMIEDLQLAD